jgi:hypothetical protein
LVLGPQMLNSHRGLTRRQILRAAGRYCDVIETSTQPDRPELIAVTYQEARKPMIAYVTAIANPDSAMYAYPSTRSFRTQAERAANYKQQVDTMFGFAASDGTHPMVGLDWWEYMDKLGEKANWGLVSLRDNAYDGKEAVIAEGQDRWGYPTGGEERAYGDFLTVVRQTNFDVFERLRQELQAGAGVTSPRGQH